MSSNPDGFFVLANPPSCMEFGIDCMQYETGPNFCGVSLVPSGLHFIYHSTGMGSRIGFFVRFQKGELVCRAWDQSTEEILPQSTISDESLQYLRTSINSGQLNNNLGPYPLSQHSHWVNLSSFIDDSVLNRANCPLDTNLHPGDDEDLAALKDHTRTPPSSLTPYFSNAPRIARFSRIEEAEKRLLRTSAASSAQARTELSMDKSFVVEHVVKTYFGNVWEALLGELQLSFLLFLLLYSHPALCQWKKLVDTLSRCDLLLTKRPKLMAAFMRILYEQLNLCPTDFFEAELSKDNFLRATMTSLFENLDTPSLSPSLLEHKKRMLLFLQKKFGLFDESAQAFVNRRGVLVHSEPFNLVESDLPVFVHPKDEAEPMETTHENDQDTNNHHFTQRLSTISAALDSVAVASHASQSNSTDVYRADYIGFTSSPVSIAVEESHVLEGEAANSAGTISNAPMTRVDVENALFSWRYPHLYDAMVSSGGAEDLTMTAVRLLDEDALGAVGPGTLQSPCYWEARMFVEEEVSRRGQLQA